MKRSLSARVALVMAAAASSCVDLYYADGDATADRAVVDAPLDAPLDAPDVVDAVSLDRAEVGDAPDVVALDAPDVVALDAPDAAPDRLDVVDVVDVQPDRPDVIDVPDVQLDRPDVIDVPDVVDVQPDRPDVIDVPDAPDVPVVFPTDEIPLAQATATFSQMSYGVSLAIRDPPTSMQGWGVSPREDVAHAAAFEFVTDTPATSLGTRVTVTLTQRLSGYRLGRFRLRVTTAPRSQFADGLETGGDVGSDAIWIAPPVVLSASRATNGVTLSLEGDGSVYASGSGLTSQYDVVLDTTASRLTGLRIDTVPDARLPGGGAGTSSGGNFVLTEVHVHVGARP